MTADSSRDRSDARPVSTERVFEVVIDGRRRHIGIDRCEAGYRVRLDGRRRMVDVVSIDRSALSLIFPEEQGRTIEVNVAEINGRDDLALHLDGRRLRVRVDREGVVRRAGSGRLEGAQGAERVVAPMPGKVVRVLVAPGDAVKTRQAVAIVEAMKMENELRASRDGVVKEVLVREGTSIDAGVVLVVIE